jgi:Protein of unknown function (DUF3667)
MEQVEAVQPERERPMIPNAAQRHQEATGSPGNARCLNCGTFLTELYCPRCGQSGHIHRTIGSLFHDFAHGVLHFEGKIWRTLPMLAWRPGELTRRYIDGERARFVSPLALFLFTAFLMFAVISNLPLVSDLPFGNARSRVDGARVLVRDQITFVQTERAKLVVQKRDTAILDRALIILRRDLKELDGARGRLSTAGPTLMLANREVRGEDGQDDWINTRWRQAKQNPDLLVYRLKNSAYKFSWALVPISIPLIWLLFARRRDVGLYDHAIFGIYSLTFVSLVAIVAALLVSIGAGPAAGLLMVIPPLHMFHHLRGTYALGWWSALWRTAALLAITGAALLAWIVMLMVVGSG